MKDLPRKRFFLIKGSLDENKSLIEKVEADGSHVARLLLPRKRRECRPDQVAERQRLRIAVLPRS